MSTEHLLKSEASGWKPNTAWLALMVSLLMNALLIAYWAGRLQQHVDGLQQQLGENTERIEHRLSAIESILLQR